MASRLANLPFRENIDLVTRGVKRTHLQVALQRARTAPLSSLIIPDPAVLSSARMFDLMRSAAIRRQGSFPFEEALKRGVPFAVMKKASEGFD